jgi:hypothetical protein
VRMESRFSHMLGGALCAALIFAPGAPAAEAPPSPSVYGGVAGTASQVALTRLSAPAPALGPGRPRTARRIPHLHTASAPTLAQAQLAPSALASPSGSLLANFNGVSSRDSAATNFGAEFEPPDQGLCVGNGFVVEMVNSAYTVYDTSGKVIAGPFNVNGPFEEGLTEFTSDPRCHYDAATHAWFATILAINKEETESFVDVAVNTSGDPTRAWTNYKINTTDNGGKTGPHHRGCPCLGDQPTLGIDAHNLYVTTNEFALASEQFNGAQVYAFAKKDLVGLKPAVHFVHFDKLTIGGGIAASVQPALTSGTPTAEYFLSALDPTETGDQRIGVWALSRGQLVAKGEVPELSSVVLPSEAYSDNPGAEQKGSSSAIDPGDDRMQQTQFSGGSVWGELGSAINIGGDGTQRAGAAWFQVEPILHKGILDGAAMQRQGYVAMPGNYVLYPALQLTPNGTAAMVMTLTGPKRFPSAAYATLAPGASTFGPITVAAPGSTNYDPNAERWGDYSWAVMDPGGASVWMATEYIPPRASQTPDGRRNWGTRVLDLSTGG